MTTGRYPWRYCCWSTAKTMSPSRMASSTEGARSKVASWISCSLPPSLRALSAGSAPVGPSASTPLISGFWLTAVSILACASVGLVRSTATTWTWPPRPSSKPSQRWSSAMFPTSWLMQSALSTPSSSSRSPAPTPASNSVWPTWVSAPSSSLTSLPEFMETIGMPASFAFWIDSLKASASGIETTRPSGSEATAASMSWLIFTMSNVCGALYSTSTPMSSAPWSTPFLTTDQNGSEAWPWVTTAILMSPRCAPPPPCASPPSWPPPQPAATSAIAATRASQTLIFALPLTVSSSPWGPREPLSLRRLDHLREILQAPAHVLHRPRAGIGAEHYVLLQDVPALVAGRLEQLQYPPHVHVPLAERPVEPAPHG